jgi:2-oxoglutarate dehydrogenase E1 component
MANLKSTSYLFGSNAVFIQELYNRYIKDPNSVDSDWRIYFSNLKDDPDTVSKEVSGAPWKPYAERIVGFIEKDSTPKNKPGVVSEMISEIAMQKSSRSAALINAYRSYGHTDVVLDPLGLKRPKYHSELDYKFHGFSESDLNDTVHVDGFFGVQKILLKDLVHYLKSTYSSRVAIEFMHMENVEERSWFINLLEKPNRFVNITKEEKLKALQDIMEAEMFESYLHVKFPGTKRFSLEGLESYIAAVECIVHDSCELGVREFVLGMAHRGRLNTLTKVMGKPYHAMLSEFKGNLAYPEGIDIPGDVKYHLGASNDIKIGGNDIHMTLTPNPSHLEVVNSVVLGKVRAKQDIKGDTARSQVLGILVHGDAAFAGQGSVMEALSLSQLTAYHTGGAIHIVTNNQIGFTTNPDDARSTMYCTDIAKFIGVPILHVNGDDPEAVVYAGKIAAVYRATFKKDVVLDIVGYRKYGHNEGDEPFFTQPLMYNVIKNKKNPAEIFSDKLIAENVITRDDYERKKNNFKNLLNEEFEISQTYKPKKADWLEGNWSKFKKADYDREEPETGYDPNKIKELGLRLCHLPDDFSANPKITRQLEAKRQMIETGKELDWGTGEALAFATLLDEGSLIRITGQDVERGTFSHRHASLFDQSKEVVYRPLNNLSASQKAFLEIKNSNLSEFAVLGFEYGYSFTHPTALTIWEAQFGDFANGAQVIIDQYISSGEAKWLRMNGLVMLLPHGYEGQGPEHSSARPERFLQLCAKDNMQVANCTTPASLFHILRRQLHRDFRKPLIIMSPKSLLRHKLAVSDLYEFKTGTSFKPVIDDNDKNILCDKITRVLICSGKVYYDLFEKRQELKLYYVALVRMEQLYPFPKKQLGEVLNKYKNAEVFWCQEEHKNMGAFFFVEPRIEKLLKDIKHKSKRAKYIGRASSASPAVGYMKLHIVELSNLLKEAFGK